MTDRERKLNFIGGKDALQRGVISMLSKHGPDWLTDDQIDDLYRAEALAWERTQRMNAESREIASARRAGEMA